VSVRPASVVGVVQEAADRGKRWGRAHPWKAIAAVAAVGVGIAGLAALGKATTLLIALGLLAVMVIAALPDAWKAKALEGLGALLAATAGLLGINVLVFDPLFGGAADSKASIVIGLFVAVVAFWAMATWYARFRGHWSTVASVAFGGVAAGLVVLGTPFLVPLLDKKDDPRTKPVTVPVPSKLDVSIVAERPQPSPALSELRPEQPPVDLQVRYSVGFRDGREVRWTLLGSPDPAEALQAVQAGGEDAGAQPDRRPGADQLVMLLVDGTPPVIEHPKELPDVEPRGGEVPRWRHVARVAGGRDAPAFALLQTTNPARLRDWTDPDAPVRPVSIQKELTSLTVTGAAVQLAIGAPTSREDFELAVHHQPVLLFDKKEPVPRPLSIDALFADDDVHQCDDGGGTDCELIGDPHDLDNGGKRLELDLPRSNVLQDRAKRELEVARRDPAALSMGRPLSTIYVHPTTREVNGRRFLYLDYWWYLPDNPARAGWGSFCGAGLVIPGVTCFDHQSDWEGITVIVDRTERRGVVDPRPVGVHYAQHNSIVSYDWNELQRHWAGDEKLSERVKGIPGLEGRPLVFVANGSHASYATRCPGIERTCRQLAHDREEGTHDGKLPWAGDFTSLCGEGSSCLQLLPTRRGGAEPALWNAFDGPWGERRCVLGTIYCNSSDPPPGPGRQGRYRRPALATGEGSFEPGKKRFKAGTVVDE
jgi:hypothetical protein